MPARTGPAPRIAVLTNRRAGRSETRMSRVVEEVARHPDLLHCVTPSLEFVPEALAELAAAGADVLVINGGDGTVQHTLTALLDGLEGQWRPWIAPLRSGRTNMIALDLGGRRDPVEGLRAVLAAGRSGGLEARTQRRPVLRVDLAGETPQYGMFFGAGMLHRAIALTHETFPEGRAQGVFGAGVVTATLVARAAAGVRQGVLGPDKMQLAFDGEPCPGDEFLLLMATGLERLFLRLRPFWGREDAPIRFTALASGVRGLARAVPGLVVGRPPAHASPERGFLSRNLHELGIRLDCGLTLDGELFAPEPGRVVTVRSDDRIRFLRA